MKRLLFPTKFFKTKTIFPLWTSTGATLPNLCTPDTLIQRIQVPTHPRSRKIIFSNSNLANEATSENDFLEFIDASKQEWYSAKEVAAILGRTDQFVRDLLDNQRLMGHALYARGNSKRKSYQIHRSALQLYLLETANYQPRDFTQRLLRIISLLPNKEFQHLKDCINDDATIRRIRLQKCYL